VHEGRSLPAPRPRAQAVLAVLLLNVNQVVSADRLIDELWPSGPPASARSALHVHAGGTLEGHIPAGDLAHHVVGRGVPCGHEDLAEEALQRVLKKAPLTRGFRCLGTAPPGRLVATYRRDSG
jgi:hypothetical protein